jgi:hypothetical protein
VPIPMLRGQIDAFPTLFSLSTDKRGASSIVTHVMLLMASVVEENELIFHSRKSEEKPLSTSRRHVQVSNVMQHR